VSWLNRLLQLNAAANSKAGARLEQTKWSRKTTRTVEITVESHEVTLYQTTSGVVSGSTPDISQPDPYAEAKTVED
jgi:hypothetical protein